MRENYTLHKLHSLTGIIPVGFYLCQHLTLNSFALAGPDAYNSVIGFFESLPPHVLFVLKYGVVWLPLIFHAAYGLIITARAEPNLSASAYKWRENRYYTWQRITGIVAILFLIYHMYTTSLAATLFKANIRYDHWADYLSQPVLGIPYFYSIVYLVGVAASAYHFSYGLWHFCIRWGIAVSENAQRNVGRVSAFMFAFLCLAAIGSLVGFFNPILKQSHSEPVNVQRGSSPIGQTMPADLRIR